MTVTKGDPSVNLQGMRHVGGNDPSYSASLDIAPDYSRLESNTRDLHISDDVGSR